MRVDRRLHRRSFDEIHITIVEVASGGNRFAGLNDEAQ